MSIKQLAVISKLFVVIIISIFGLFACSVEKDFRQNFVIAESKSYEASLFRQNCAICHGSEANGKEINGKQIPSLRFGDAAKRSKEEIYNQIANGKLPMPSFKNQLTEDEIQKMVNFVMRDLQGRDEGATK